MEMKKQDALVVVGIDFGTTYSGYGYSFRDEYKKDHSTIFTLSIWNSGGGLATTKTPTVILFDENGKFHSFGYTAEEDYSRLLQDGKADGYSYFSCFKMKLFPDEESTELVNPRLKGNNTISRNLILEDGNGHTMNAMKVFSESIKYLKDKLWEELSKRVDNLVETDIHWVLTVPAIWKDNAKQFMREAAQQAGIDPELLTLAYEPEAAAIYCKELTVQKKKGAEGSNLQSFEPGQQFLVLDCGGGTIDVTSYQVQNDSELKELHIPSGGPWGGTCVDREYLAFLENLFERDVWSEFIKQYPEDLLEIKRKFEAKKRGFTAELTEMTIAYPPSLFTKYIEKRKVQSVKEGFEKSCYSQTITVVSDKLRFDPGIMKQFNKKTTDSIIAHVKDLLVKNKRQGRGIGTILMVGGYSDSPLLYERVNSEFPKLNVICPSNAVSSILRGAVMYGHNQESISERICPRTYGISVNAPFDYRKHSTTLKTFSNGRYVCTNVFKVMVRLGEPLIVGKSNFVVSCAPNKEFDSEAYVAVYESFNENPMYALTDKCTKSLGMLKVPMPDIAGGHNRRININMHFGYTELFVTASEEGTNRKVEANFNCL